MAKRLTAVPYNDYEKENLTAQDTEKLFIVSDELAGISQEAVIDGMTDYIGDVRSVSVCMETFSNIFLISKKIITGQLIMERSYTLGVYKVNSMYLCKVSIKFLNEEDYSVDVSMQRIKRKSKKKKNANN